MKWIPITRTPRMATVVMAFLLAGVWQQTTPAHAAPSLTLSSSVVPQGTSMKITGSGFTPNDTVALYFDAPVNTKTAPVDNKSRRINKGVKADNSGSFTTRLKIPQGTLPISYKLIAVDNHQVATGQNFIVQAALTVRPNGSIPWTTVVAGHNVLVNVKGFAANESVRIQSTFPNYSGVDIAATRSVTANVKGSSSGALVNVPVGAKVGWTPLNAIGLQNNKTAQGNIYVTYRPTISLKAPSVAAGRWAVVSGKGFAANDALQVQIPVTTKTGTQILTVVDAANANGYFSKWVRIPNTTSAGNYIVTVVSSDTGLKRTAKLNVYIA
jgi:hypothetical protein